MKQNIEPSDPSEKETLLGSGESFGLVTKEVIKVLGEHKFNRANLYYQSRPAPHLSPRKHMTLRAALKDNYTRGTGGGVIEVYYEIVSLVSIFIESIPFVELKAMSDFYAQELLDQEKDEQVMAEKQLYKILKNKYEPGD